MFQPVPKLEGNKEKLRWVLCVCGF